MIDEDHIMQEVYPDYGMKSPSDFIDEKHYISYLRRIVVLPDPKRTEDDTDWNYQLRWESHAKARYEARKRLDEINKIKDKEKPKRTNIFQFRSLKPVQRGLIIKLVPQNIFGGAR